MNRKVVVLLSFMVCFLCISFHSKKENKDLEISIDPSFNDEPLVLNTLKYITAKNDTVSISLLKFYISNVVLEFENGTTFSETKSCHLINLEEVNSLKFYLKEVSNFKIKKIRFNIGIDSLTNVSGDLQGDLDPSLGMYWAWNSGYINMKLEGKSSSCKSTKKEFQFHIGGYLPNQNAIEKVSLMVPNNSNSIKIKVDVSKWLNEVALKESNSIMIPGEKAMVMAHYYKNMFSIN